jgi:type IV pilus assembly protein PilA
MQIHRRTRSQRGFTLMELMVSAGLIGVLAAIAIPNFISYQARSRRSEAYANLASLARAQKAFQAESNEYVDTTLVGSNEPAVPNDTNYGGLGTKKMPWDSDAGAFSNILGWSPEGQVFYSYGSNTGDPASATACSCDLCFTATAHGDVDGDGSVGALMYVHPQSDSTGTVTGVCSSHLFAYSTPTRPDTGDPIYEEVAVYLAVDPY